MGRSDLRDPMLHAAAEGMGPDHLRWLSYADDELHRLRVALGLSTPTGYAAGRPSYPSVQSYGDLTLADRDNDELKFRAWGGGRVAANTAQSGRRDPTLCVLEVSQVRQARDYLSRVLAGEGNGDA